VLGLLTADAIAGVRGHVKVPLMASESPRFGDLIHPRVSPEGDGVGAFRHTCRPLRGRRH
jgi:hypothetical protein